MKAVTKDSHFTVLGFTAPTGKPVMCAIIFAAKHLCESWVLGFNAAAGEWIGDKKICEAILKVLTRDILVDRSVPSMENRSRPSGCCSENGSITAELLVAMLTALDTSKGTFLRVNNNNENFSSDVLYFLGKNLKKVQDSCWYFRICANIQVSELQRHIFLGTLFRTPFHDFIFCLIRIRNH